MTELPVAKAVADLKQAGMIIGADPSERPLEPFRCAPKPLAGRLRAVCELVAQGLTHKEIAARLNLAVGTVKIYRSLAAKSMGVSAAELTRMVYAQTHRDYQRVQAIKLDRWLRKYGSEIPPGASAEMRTLIAECVSELFSGG